MIQKFNFFCKPAGEDRRIHLYLPDDYDKSDERYAVLYMFDGHNLFFDSDATFGKSLGLKEFLDGWWKRLIVVGMECAKDNWARIREYCPYNVVSRYYGRIPGIGHQTLEWIEQDLKPFIDQNYRTWPHREATAIAGYSMGGMMSLYAIVKFNHLFSKAAAISPAIQPAMKQFRDDIGKADIANDTRIFFSWGTVEQQGNPGLEDRIREMEWLVQQKGASTYLFRNEGGTHNEASWQHEVPTWMHFLWE